MKARGFTLLEVLVALGIFAVVAASVLTLAQRSVQNAARLEAKTLAMWVADNRLVELQLQGEAAGIGQAQGEVHLANRTWLWQSLVEPAAEPLQRKISIWVAQAPLKDASIEDAALAFMLGSLEVRP